MLRLRRRWRRFSLADGNRRAFVSGGYRAIGSGGRCRTPEQEAQEEQRKSLYDVLEAAAAFYEDQLLGAAGRTAREYLKSRGLDGAAAKRFRLGYAPGGSPLIEHLKTRNVTQDQIIAAGLARPS